MRRVWNWIRDPMSPDRELFGIPANEPIAWVPILPVLIVVGALIGTLLDWWR